MAKTTEQILRDRYFFNDLFKLGDIVECVHTSAKFKVLNRGSNYVTVATDSGEDQRKWLHEIAEVIAPVVVPESVIPDLAKEAAKEPEKIGDITNENKPENEVANEVAKDPNFELLESGQIKIFGYETRNFDRDTSEFLIEQFSEPTFTDLYSKHQIIKCLDFALHEEDTARAYELLTKVESFYTKQNMLPPIIVEVAKNDTERTRIAEILAVIAGVAPSKQNSKTVTDSIKSLREKYQTRNQWEVLFPFLRMARDSGLPGAVQNLPYNVSSATSEAVSVDEIRDHITMDTMIENIELVVADLEYDDIAETFTEEEFSLDTLEEGLSIETRQKLSLKLKQHSPQLQVRRERALNKGASTAVLMQRARRLAETMMKRRLFHKPAADMTRQEKERFESGAGKRQALINKLAQRLVPKVRALQTARLHHSNTPVSPTKNVIAHHSAGSPGAS